MNRSGLNVFLTKAGFTNFLIIKLLTLTLSELDFCALNKNEIFISKMVVKINYRIITRSNIADPEIEFLTKSVLQPFLLNSPFRSVGVKLTFEKPKIFHI